MQWKNEAIILSAKKFNENALIVSLITEEIGQASCLVKNPGYKSNIYLAGNLVLANWRGKNANSLGELKSELITALKFLSRRPEDVNLINSALELVKTSLSEQEGKNRLFSALKNLIELFNKKVHPLDLLIFYFNFELLVLEDIGYGLDLFEYNSKQLKAGNFLEKASGKLLDLSLENLKNEEQAEDLYFKLPEAFLFLATPSCNNLIDDIKFFYSSSGNFYESLLDKIAKSTETSNPTKDYIKAQLFEALNITGFFLGKFLQEHKNKKLPEVRSSLKNGLY